MDTSLVCGYIREIDHILENDKKIPDDIYRLCFDFYHISKFIFYLSALKDDTNFLTAANLETKQKWNMSIHEITNNKKSEEEKKISFDHKQMFKNGGITFHRNVRLPSNIKSEMPNISKVNNVIFRCGGGHYRSYKPTNYCSAFIFDSHQLTRRNRNQTVDAYNLKLPSLPSKMTDNFLLYSNVRNELWSIGGIANEEPHFQDIYTLSFGNDVYYPQDLGEWSWKKRYTKLQPPRACSCAVMIDNDTKMIVIGGTSLYEDINNVELLDIDGNEWIDVKNKTYPIVDSGIYYHEMKEMIYVGGGQHFSDPIDLVECFDIEKNVWKVLPATNNKHDCHSLIWIEDNNLLNIMSVSSNYIENIDLREGKKWKIVNDIDLAKYFHCIFGADEDDVDRELFRLAGN